MNNKELKKEPSLPPEPRWPLLLSSGVAILLLGVIFFALWYLTSFKSKTPKTIPIVNVGMILAKGGLGDRSYNDAAYLGLQDAQDKFGIRFEAITYSTDKENLDALRNLALQNYDLIIAISFENAPYIEQLSKEFPDNKFAIIDFVVEGDNVSSVLFREEEGDFLMGVLSTMITKTKKVGFIGGVDIPILRKIESGFRNGVAYEDSTVEVNTDFVGSFNDPDLAKTVALKQYDEGIDLIYNVAGRSGLGLIDAAKERNEYIIVTNGIQTYIAPGNIIGNRPKRIDSAVYNLIAEVIENRFEPGTRSLGLKEGGITIGPFDAAVISQDMISYLEELQEKIINGEIKVIE